MAELKPAYLIHGDDHGAVGERRAGLRALAEGEGGAELLEGDQATPAGAAAALATMTLAGGRRVVIVGGAEGRRQGEGGQHLLPAPAPPPPDTTPAGVAPREGKAQRA